MNRETKVAICMVIVPLILGACALSAWFFMLLWNAVVFGIFHGPILTFWQAVLVWLFIGAIAGCFKSGK